MRLPYRRIDPGAAAVAVLALVLRTPLLFAALPGVGNSDEPLNIAVGVRMASTGTLDAHTYRYPGLLYEVIAGVTQAFRAVGLHVSSHGAMRIENLGVAHTDARSLIVAIRFVGVIASVATCLLVWATVRGVLKSFGTSERWGRIAAALAAVTVAVSPLATANSVYATPDVYAGFAVALTLYGTTRILRAMPHGELICGFGVGLALGAKYLAAAVLPVIVAYALSPGRRKDLLKVAGIAAAVFVVTTPGLVLHPGAVLAGVKAEAIHYQAGHVGAEGDAPGFYLNALFRDQPVLLDAAGVALVAVFRTGDLVRRTLIVIFAYAIPQFLLLSTMAVRFDRNLVPLTPALAVLAGVAGPVMFPRRHRRAVAAVTAAAAFLPLASSARLYPRLDEHSRTQAAAWVAHHVPDDQPVAVESYGPWLDPDRFHLVPLTFATDRPAVQARALILTQHAAGRFLSDPVRYPREAAAYRELTSRYRLAARFTAGSWIEVYVPR
ncbi:ArnT family glycosyltransferase [Catenulispora subtropica]|uniref:Glycosyltransferase RgtA/B/C/D-like domain-containing protein n=1 Tax=Catenulispora subtropica TaxID=450798 RepID=A0ABN2RLU9_9ACTN